jgi:polysaccharide pyruvyl transferase WcaK-like protein
MRADTRVDNAVVTGAIMPLSLGSETLESPRQPGSTSSKMTPGPTRKTIALFGMFGVGNLGNECTLQAILANLRRFLPDAQVRCICGGPDETAFSSGIPSFAIRDIPLTPLDNRILRLLRRFVLGILIDLGRWVRVIQKVAGTDMLVMTGTGMLSDVGISPFGLHYDILRWSIAAKLCRCKLLFVSVGVGPIRRPLSTFFVKAALRLADYRSYRDVSSKSYVEGMGIAAAPDAVYPDLAFSLPAGTLPNARAYEGHKAVIGIGLITYDTSRTGNPEMVETIYRDYVAKIAEFVRWLIEHDYTVRFLIGDVVYDTRVRQDLRAFLERCGLRYEDGQIIDEPARSVDELRSQLASTNIVVASRFHNVLLALMLGKPVLAISFHEKVDSLMNAMEMTEFCQDIENVDVRKSSESITRGLALKSELFRSNLELQYEYIFETLPAPIDEPAASRGLRGTA